MVNFKRAKQELSIKPRCLVWQFHNSLSLCELKAYLPEGVVGGWPETYFVRDNLAFASIIFFSSRWDLGWHSALSQMLKICESVVKYTNLL